VSLTSNYPHVLDSALMRPGRVDRKIHIGYAKPSQVKRRFLQFFDAEPEAKGDTFARALLGAHQDVTMAEVQGYLLVRRASAARALDEIGQLRTESI